AAMIPSPGELFGDWWANAGYEETGYDDVFYNEVPPALAAEARRRARNECSRALDDPWPLTAWPATPTRYLLCRDDRLFSAAWAPPPPPRAARRPRRRDGRWPLCAAQPAGRARRAPRRLRRRPMSFGIRDGAAPAPGRRSCRASAAARGRSSVAAT